VLSDNDKRNKYNYEIKKYGSNDGLTIKPTIEKEERKVIPAKEEDERKVGAIEIPANPSMLGIKELK